MKKYLILFLLVSIVFSMASCGGGGAGSSSSPPGENPGVPFLIQLRPSQSIAQTNTFIYIRARVLNGNGNPIPNIPVTFTNLSSIGELNYARGSSIHHALTFVANLFSVGELISTGANTDTNGFATVKLSSTTPGFSTVQAEVNTGSGQVRDKKTVYFSLFDMTLPSPPAPAIPYLTLDVDTDQLFNTPNEPSDLNLFETANDNQVFVRATVFDGNHNVVPNSTVIFGADSTEATFPLGNTKTTDASGRASVLVQVDPIILRTATTVLNITASADNGAAGMITLYLQPVVVDTTNSYLTANPTTVPPSGTSAILAVIMLNTGSPAPDGTAVTFTTTCGSVTPFGQTTDGVATATFTAPSIPGTCTVTGRVGGTTIGTAAITVSNTLTVIPTTQTISNPTVGNTRDYTILGGTGPYSAFSNNPALVTVPSGTFTGPTLTATVAPGVSTLAADTTVTITIYDSVGDSVTASLILDIVPTEPLNVTPSSITITGLATGTGDNVPFYISGGSGTYTGVFSNNTAVIPNPTITGNNFTIDPNPVAANTTVTLTVTDSLGATGTATVTVTPATSAMAINPSTIAVTTGTSISFNIIGGTSPYSVYSSNTGIVALGGNPYVIPPGTNPFTATTPGTGSATVTVVDADAKTVTASVTVNALPTPPTPPTPDFTLSCNPATLTISALSSGLTVCRITSVNSYSAPVTLACLGLPGASTCTFNPVSPVTPPAGLSIDVTVTVNVGAVASNTYPFVFQGSGGATHTVPLTLIVP